MQADLQLSENETAFAHMYIDKLEKRGRRTPVMMVFTAAMSLLLITYGVREMYAYRVSLQPGPTILQRLDAVPSDESTPAILRVSGQSRKGLLLVEAESQMRSMDAMLGATGFTFFVMGVFGLAFVLVHRRDGARDIIIAKLMRSYIQRMDPKEPATGP